MTTTTLIIDNDPAFASSLVRLVKREGFRAEVAFSGDDALNRISEIQPDLVIVDLGLPGMDGVDFIVRLKKLEPHAVVIALCGSATVESAVATMHAGAFDFLTKSAELEEIQFKLLKAIEVADLRKKVQFFTDRERAQKTVEMVGESPMIKEVYARIQEIAKTSSDTTVLILGETGSGKELVARAIHNMSDRGDKPMVSVNCTAVPDNLLESEFFGYEKGAFTSADRSKPGLVEVARSGTLFLDEIGDLNLNLQGKLLRLIEERRYKRVGGIQDLEADVRFIAATNRNLEQMAGESLFREDLLYRLNVFQIVLPPLRERGEDILSLARHFIQQFNVQFNKEVVDLDHEAKEALMAYPFPGNVRQLRNFIEQAMILARGKLLTVDRFQGLRPKTSSGNKKITYSGLLSTDIPLDQKLAEVREQEKKLQQVEKEIINTALEQVKGNKSQAANLLGISRYALQRRLRRLNPTPQ